MCFPPLVVVHLTQNPTMGLEWRPLPRTQGMCTILTTSTTLQTLHQLEMAPGHFSMKMSKGQWNLEKRQLTRRWVTMLCAQLHTNWHSKLTMCHYVHTVAPSSHCRSNRPHATLHLPSVLPYNPCFSWGLYPPPWVPADSATFQVESWNSAEFHGTFMESNWLEPQPFWFPIPWKFQLFSKEFWWKWSESWSL